MNKVYKSKIYFITFFIIILSVTIFILNSIKDNNIDKYLEKENEKFNLNYNVIYNNYKKIADLIFKIDIQDEKILTLFSNRDREALENYLDNKYKILKSFNLRQLHFHLPNNDSFLRMHRPNKFGDNLTKDRKTVAYVNKNKKYIHGFEEGKVFNGFRFVYPLFFNEKYIGSVEVSFSALFFIQDIAKSYGVKANFLIKKNVVNKKVFKDEMKNYVQSPIRDYYYQKSILKNLNLLKDNRVLDTELENQILSKMKENKTFSIYVPDFEEIALFLPVENPITKKNVAFLKISENSHKIQEIKNNFYNYLILSTLLIFVILIYLYSQFNYQLRLREVVAKKTKELNKLNNNLKKTVKKEVAKNREKDKLMVAQSRHAAMGEMISMIAHQWRQPLTTISMNVNNILADIELEDIDEENLKTTSQNIIQSTQYLSKTIDDFRDFFKPDKSHELINIKDVINNSIAIIGASLKSNDIKLNIECNSTKSIETYPRELLQVLINIIKNAKEALEKIPEENKKIDIFCEGNEEFIKIDILNNADKIPEDMIEKIFVPYFTTKDKNIGTGLGLYMSKIIVEKHLNGELTVQNEKEGVSFTIKLPYQFHL